jgi:iron-sulfur cluster assembly protein
MFEITQAAAVQVISASRQGGTEGMVLRLAANLNDDGSINYIMGFDEPREDDIRMISNGVEVVMAPEYVPLLDEAVMDFVEIEEDDFRFIFLNPKDANYSPPTERR